jgi:hypothetical protein
MLIRNTVVESFSTGGNGGGTAVLGPKGTTSARPRTSTSHRHLWSKLESEMAKATTPGSKVD